MIGEAGFEWDWSKNFNDFAEDMDGDFKPVSEMNCMMLEAGKGKFESFAVKTNQNGVQAYAVRCGEKSFVYLHNPGENFKGIQLSGMEAQKGKARLSLFDGETVKYSPLKFSALPDKSLNIDLIEIPSKGNAILILE